ncbi:DNA-3-methyladenine glycosylase family protein [Jeotgalibacillus proteolyticus]|uniref:DNA-3-methyladenine glycosylase II n=1 Tax=Jeotgalibacillus proteolyticus TaxID=2082395 RepID=A0A2S5G784_9BACL|nr:DNA-3-methyladenine glycosylase [Jeotgalibacillus proteolyticus]PPA68846.1 DNA-3-methyladenine glycosylase [Jeotgalibacillus proteolyticus]
MWKEQISVDGPYAFDRVLQRMSIDPLNHIDEGKQMVKLPYTGAKKQAVTITGIGTTQDPVFIVEGTYEEDRKEIIRHVKDLFHWNHSLNEVDLHFSSSTLSNIFDVHKGTPLVREPSVYSCLLKSIIHQQLNMAFAAVLTERFVTTYGENIEDVWFYPEPQTVAEITVEELRALQFSQRKAEYVIGVGKKILSGELELDRFPEMSDEEIIEELVKLRGVGPWTAQNVLLFGLGRMDIFPFADIGIQNALKKQFNMERKPTILEMEEWTESWRPYLSYASLYLWRSIETGK